MIQREKRSPTGYLLNHTITIDTLFSRGCRTSYTQTPRKLHHLVLAGPRWSEPSTPISSNCATMAARDPTPSFAKIRRKWVQTVQELMLSTSAIIFLGCPLATILTISCSRGLRRMRAELGLGIR